MANDKSSLILISRANFIPQQSDWLFGFSNQYADWLNFINLPGYKLKTKLITRKIKIEGQALNSISTILKFSARDN